MARSSTTVKPGQSLNPFGGRGLDARARRSFGEALRGLASPEEIGRALLSIAAGVDPWARPDEPRPNPDGLPTAERHEEAIPWSARSWALETFLAYAQGKPAQAVHVQSEIDARIAVEHVTTASIDFGSMPAEVRSALRAAALVALGRAPRPLQVSARVVDHGSDAGPAHADHVAAADRDDEARALGPASSYPVIDLDVDGSGVDPVLAGQLVEQGALEGGQRDHGQRVVEVQHGQTVGPPGLGVKAPEREVRLEFPGSTNVARARLDLDPGGPRLCSVTFRGAGGERTYQYRNVTPEMMAAWREAPSAGAWFAREIRQRSQQYPVVAASARHPGAAL